MRSPHTPPDRRFGWIDALILGAVVVGFAYIYHRVSTVLEYKWNWSYLPEYLIRFDAEQGGYVANILLLGTLTTIRLAIWSMLLAALLGVLLGIMRTMHSLLPRLISRAYVELVRNTPPLVFIFIFYFFVSSQLMPMLGLADMVNGASDSSKQWIEFLFGPTALFENVVSGIICLALFEAAYVTEIVRAGVESVPKNQYEAGLSVGLTRFQLLKSIILPQAIQKVIPPLANQFITLIKDSSIVSLISIQELTFLAQEVSVSTQRVFETWIAVAGIYFIICYSLALLFGWLERRSARASR